METAILSVLQKIFPQTRVALREVKCLLCLVCSTVCLAFVPSQPS